MTTLLSLTLAAQLLTGTAAPVLGTATWYGTGPGAGVAAAGPALRAALGPHWRGRIVRVCHRYHPARCVRVRLADWCACRRRLVDLSDEDFRRLTPLWRGVVSVRVLA